MNPLITTELVALDADLGRSSSDVIAALAARLAAAGRVADVDGFIADVMDREGQAATGLPGGIAIPHCRSAHVTTGSLGFARLDPPVDFGAPDGPADLAFMIAAPAEGDADHMKLLTALARALVRDEFTAALRSADSPAAIVDLVSEVVEPVHAPAAAAAAAAVPATPATPGARTIVAITACPTGIAHTYMAADKLVAAGKTAGIEVIVETQGSSGSTPLAAEQISQASAVIFATDVGVKDKGRFAGKPVVASGVKRAINEPEKMISEALAAADDPNGARVDAEATSSAAAASSGDVGIGTQLRQWLLTGVSYMIPFVAAGGLLIALGFLIAGYDITDTASDVVVNNSFVNLPDGGMAQYIGAVLFTLGALAFGFLVPALAGYIAYAIADRPGIAPGFTVGVVATTIGAGFIGGLVGGLLAGLVARWISGWNVPQWGRGLMPVVVTPLLATLIAGGLMVAVLGQPLAAITSGLESWLGGLSGGSTLLLGVVLGAMMAFDMGGPVNKAAYAFAAAGLSAAGDGNNTPLVIMATVMAAGMTPPLGLAMATALRPKSFTKEERENGKANWLLGASFITEGAIPFAAADPLRVIPPIMLGSAVTGAIVAVGGVTLRAPHGGVFVLFAMTGIGLFLAALAIGTVITAIGVLVAKKIGREPAMTAA